MLTRNFKRYINPTKAFIKNELNLLLFNFLYIVATRYNGIRHYGKLDITKESRRFH